MLIAPVCICNDSEESTPDLVCFTDLGLECKCHEFEFHSD